VYLYLLICHLEFKYLKNFNFYDGSEDAECLQYLLNLQNFVVDKLTDDATFVLEHVGVGT